MGRFQAAKVINSLPGTLTPDTVYCVRAGAGFDLYVSDNTGSYAHKVNPSEDIADLKLRQARTEMILQRDADIASGKYVWGYNFSTDAGIDAASSGYVHDAENALVSNASPLPAFLLHCDGADSSTTFADDGENGITVTAMGNAQVDTEQSKFGGASSLYDGTGDYLQLADHADLQFGAGNFTLEAWLRPASVTGQKGIFGKGTGSFSPIFLWLNGASLQIYASSTGSSWDLASAVTVGTVSANTWHHIAVVRDGGNCYAFLDGVKTTVSTSWGSTSIYNPPIGWTVGKTASYVFNGHIDEVRFSSNAEYTEDFTPAASAFSSGAQNMDLISPEYAAGIEPDTLRIETEYNAPNEDITPGTDLTYKMSLDGSTWAAVDFSGGVAYGSGEANLVSGVVDVSGQTGTDWQMKIETPGGTPKEAEIIWWTGTQIT